MRQSPPKQPMLSGQERVLSTENDDDDIDDEAPSSRPALMASDASATSSRPASSHSGSGRGSDPMQAFRMLRRGNSSTSSLGLR